MGLILDGLVAVLLAATIYYAVVLNRRLAAVRDREADLQSMIAEFNQAAVAAEGSAVTLQVAGANAEKTLRAAIDDSELVTKRLRVMMRDAEELAENLFIASRPAASNEPIDRAAEPTAETAPPIPDPPRDDAPVAGADEFPASFAAQPDEPGPDADAPVDPRVRAEQVVLEAIRSSGLGR